MKYKKLTHKEKNELLYRYSTLTSLINVVHSTAISILEKKYQEYLQNFNPKVLWIFTRAKLSFEEAISTINDLGGVSIEEYSGKRYIQLSYCFSPKSSSNVLHFNEKESNLIEAAYTYGINIFENHDPYINRLNRYGTDPLELERSDFDNFDKYLKWYNALKEVWDDYNKVP